MKIFIPKPLRPIAIGVTLCAILLFTASWHYRTNVTSTSAYAFFGVADAIDNPFPVVTSNIMTTFAVVDAETEAYIPTNKVYNRYDALALRASLEQQQTANQQSLAINLALVKFHANAPNFSGGFKGEALRYAANIYRLNSYIGCLAYEYIYEKSYELNKAEKWYKNSLICHLQDGMEWIEVNYTSRAPFGVAVTGNFNNGKLQPLYENVWGQLKRRIMVPKCVGECYYTLIPNYLRDAKKVKGEPAFENW
jgi:hypothetical protein